MTTKQTYLEKIEASIRVAFFMGTHEELANKLFSLFCEMHKELLPERLHLVTGAKIYNEAIDDMRAKIKEMEKGEKEV